MARLGLAGEGVGGGLGVCCGQACTEGGAKDWLGYDSQRDRKDRFLDIKSFHIALGDFQMMQEMLSVDYRFMRCLPVSWLWLFLPCIYFVEVIVLSFIKHYFLYFYAKKLILTRVQSIYGNVRQEMHAEFS